MQYEINLTSIIVDWIEEGDVVPEVEQLEELPICWVKLLNTWSRRIAPAAEEGPSINTPCGADGSLKSSEGVYEEWCDKWRRRQRGLRFF